MGGNGIEVDKNTLNTLNEDGHKLQLSVLFRVRDEYSQHTLISLPCFIISLKYPFNFIHSFVNDSMVQFTVM